MHNEELAARYSKILGGVDPSLIDGSTDNGLSEIFLSTVGDGYVNAANKIMIVGSETAGWKFPVTTRSDRMDDYIARAMVYHKSFFANELKSTSKGVTFHNFVRKVAKRSGGDGLIYANLFCFDWRRKSPMKHPRFAEIKRHSQALLKAQIDVLQPDIIIFANGGNTAGCRREYFPTAGPGQVCTNMRDHVSAGVERDHLWEFDLHERIRCFRIHHPATKYKAARQAARAREFLIGLLPAAA